MGAIAETTGIVFVPDFPDWLKPVPTPQELALSVITAERAAIIKAMYRTHNMGEIAEATGVSRSTVNKYIVQVLGYRRR